MRALRSLAYAYQASRLDLPLPFTEHERESFEQIWAIWNNLSSRVTPRRKHIWSRGCVRSQHTASAGRNIVATTVSGINYNVPSPLWHKKCKPTLAALKEMMTSMLQIWDASIGWHDLVRLIDGKTLRFLSDSVITPEVLLFNWAWFIQPKACRQYGICSLAIFRPPNSATLQSW